MELPYAAGLFDGEGSVTITKPSARSDRHRVVVQIAMTHEPTIREVEARFGGYVQRVNQGRYNPRARDRYDWRLTGAPALEFLRLILPWLITKKRPAEIAVDFPFAGRGTAVPPVMYEIREALRLELREENRRGA